MAKKLKTSASEADAVLSPFSHPPVLRTAREKPLACVLIVGPGGSGKSRLASLLRSQEGKLTIRVHTTEALPAPIDERIDFLVFLLDVTNAKSLPEFAKSIEFVDPSFWNGRACIVFSHMDQRTAYAFQPDAPELLCSALERAGVPRLYGNLSDPDIGASVADRVLRLVALAARAVPVAPPLLAAPQVVEAFALRT